MKILEVFRDLMQNEIRKAQLKVTPNIKHTIIGIVTFFVICFLIYVFSWLYLFFTNTDGRTQISLIQEWRSFLTLLVSGSMIAAVITILKIVFVDNNSDGVPDVLEEDENSRRPIMPPSNIINNNITTSEKK